MRRYCNATNLTQCNIGRGDRLLPLVAWAIRSHWRFSHEAIDMEAKGAEAIRPFSKTRSSAPGPSPAWCCIRSRLDCRCRQCHAEANRRAASRRDRSGWHCHSATCVPTRPCRWRHGNRTKAVAFIARTFRRSDIKWLNARRCRLEGRTMADLPPFAWSVIAIGKKPAVTCYRAGWPSCRSRHASWQCRRRCIPSTPWPGRSWTWPSMRS